MQDGVSLAPLMEKKRDFPGRGLEVETFFNTPDATEDPEDPPLNYRGVRTDRYLYAEHGSGEQELYDLRSDPFELQNQAGNPVYAPSQGALRAPALLASELRRQDLQGPPGGEAEGALLERQGRRQGQAAGGDLLPARQEGSAGCEAADPGPRFPARPQAPSWRRW